MLPEQFQYGRLQKFQGFISFDHHPTHRWLSLTAPLAATYQPEGEGPCDSCALHCTQLSPALYVFRHIKNCAYHRNGITENFSGLKTELRYQTAGYLENGYRPMPTLRPPEPFHLVLTVGPPLPLPFAPSESNCARKAEREVNLWLVSGGVAHLV